MKLSHYVFDFLVKKGVDTVFYLPGGGCMHLMDSLASNRDLNAFSLLHEQAVAVACESYVNTSGKTGVALVTTGPGATNTITGMLAAYLDSSPCLFISGQVKTADLKSNFGVRSHGSQEADIVSIVSSITKYAVMVTDKTTIRYHLERAWHEASSGRRGPVLIDIPLDIQAADIDPASLPAFTPEEKRAEFDAASLIPYINNARRPVIIAGNGLVKCKEAFYSMLDVLKFPVIPSWKAMDYIANDNPLYAGRAGGMGDRHGNLTMQNADLIISLGCRLDYSITGFDRTAWAPRAKKIIVDIDSAELAKLKNAGDTIPVHADVELVITSLLSRKNEIHVKDISVWKERINYWKQKYPVAVQAHADNAKLKTCAFIDALSSVLPETAHIAPCSSGTTAEIFFQTFTVKAGQKIRSNHGLGSMGFEIPNAIGMCAASGCQNTYCVAGDGGMQLNIQELAVISARALPVKLFVINNNGYASIRNMQNNHFKGRHAGCDRSSGLFLPDTKKLAAAYDIKYRSLKKPDEIEAVLRDVINTEGPVICEVFVEEECLVSPRAATIISADGSMRSSPLENQFPFLSEEEMRENMNH
ncbi:MAG: thiamine pyrophosphate-binding protein [Spirochaetaceae bacterium]|jgi:acetolactate synthase-1/2/3 large subunit|nr:thiamine pyrophosphate-binding protein [Spirochaetaceae bacterium]